MVTLSLVSTSPESQYPMLCPWPSQPLAVRSTPDVAETSGKTPPACKGLEVQTVSPKTCRWPLFLCFICVPFKRKRSLLTGETSFNPQGHQWRLTAVLRPSQLRTQQTYLCLKQSPAAMELQRGDHHQVSIKNLPMVSEVFGATSSPYAEGEGTNMFSVHTVFMETHTFS